jgi:hypothetical protein
MLIRTSAVADPLAHDCRESSDGIGVIRNQIRGRCRHLIRDGVEVGNCLKHRQPHGFSDALDAGFE